jgi:hypothetical protein
LTEVGSPFCVPQCLRSLKYLGALPIPSRVCFKRKAPGRGPVDLAAEAGNSAAKSEVKFVELGRDFRFAPVFIARQQQVLSAVHEDGRWFAC